MVGVVVVGGGVVGVLWAGIVEESRAESKELSNVRVQGQDCRVSTCYSPGPTAQAIISPLCGATACHYSNTHIHAHTYAHVLTQLHEHAHTSTCTYSQRKAHESCNPLCCLRRDVLPANRCKHKENYEEMFCVFFWYIYMLLMPF